MKIESIQVVTGILPGKWSVILLRDGAFDRNNRADILHTVHTEWEASRLAGQEIRERQIEGKGEVKPVADIPYPPQDRDQNDDDRPLGPDHPVYRPDTGGEA